MAGLDESILQPLGFQSEVDFTVHEWSKKFECKTLTERVFLSYWAANVPLLYSPSPGCDCLNLTFDEDAAKRILFTPLERFICGSLGKEDVLEELKKFDNPPALCGKVFKMGEPTYSCRDCGLDPTCVLCVDCFKNSEHKSHRYKMSMSIGGGFCDCGDVEAWKAHPFCQIHLNTNSQNLDSNDVLSRLPPELVERFRLVLQIALRFCHQLLTWEEAVSLPADLNVTPSGQHKKEQSNTYVTVLLNDEVHTYEQVIQTLGRAISCTQKQAIDYATTIDREGRSIVKCGNFDACKNIQETVERITSRQSNRPLKTIVMPTNLIAYQIFAMRLLTWQQHILAVCEGFRLVFGEVMMETHFQDGPLLENVMLSDTQLWKTARNQWHQLFITGMLMDTQSKKTFAKVFTRNYPTLMKDFIVDDHEHSHSVTSLSVQIFTVPTLAHMLIEDGALATLFRTFLNEAAKYLNTDNKLSFDRSSTNSVFRRAQYILYDIKYLLTIVPQVWSDTMRKSFMAGMQSLLQLLSWMQGMDSVVRQVGQHVEFEAEWETGINLQFKLFPVVCLVTSWCGSNRQVLIRALRAALKSLETLQSRVNVVTRVREVANHSASCIDYDVMSMPVTVHLPLTRLITSSLLHLSKYSLTYDSAEFGIPNKPVPEQLMELPLRCLVMVSQFRVGMWRRNGYSLLNQVYFYQNVRLREEMLDRDIQMLQISAALIESNEFLIHMLNKFVLLSWAKDTGEFQRKLEDESIRPTISLAEEFLGLVLTLVSERHTPGIGNITEADRIKKEIIQLLCIESMPHSQLFKMLPKDGNHETGMEDVIDQVAQFRKPKGSATGKYELKGEFYKDFNPFFYHYTREEQSRAQEVQLKRKKQMGEEECCPPPLPPEFAPGLVMVSNLLQCDVMLHIMKHVLRRTVDLQSPLFSEIQVEKLLHLIGVALHEEQRYLEQSSETPFFNFTSKAMREGILSLLEDCLKCPRIEMQKDLLKWTLKKFRHVESLNEKDKVQTCALDVEGPSGQQQQILENRKRNAEKAAERRARIMAQMSNMQKNFIRKYADLFEEANDSEGTSTLDETTETRISDPVLLGINQRGRSVHSEMHTCILCRENQEVSVSGRTLVMSAFVQRSTVLSKNRQRFFDDPDSYDPLLMPVDMFSGPHISSCGHVMHSDCWQKFFDSVLHKEKRRPLRYGRHVSFIVDKNEFLCPLCERLSNSVIPLVPPICTMLPADMQQTAQLAMDDLLMCLRKAVEKIQVQRHKDQAAEMDALEKYLHRYKLCSLEEVVSGLHPSVAEQFVSLFACYQPASGTASNLPDGASFSNSLTDMMKIFSQATFMVGLGVDPNPENENVPLLSWWSTSYSVHAVECLLREQKKPLFGSLSYCQDHCLSALARFIGSCVKVFDAQVIRTHCIRLLRFLLLGDQYLSSHVSIIEVDAFGLLVSLSLSLPSLYTAEEGGTAENVSTSLPFPLGHTMDLLLLQFTYVLHLAQLLLTYEFVDETPMEVDPAVTMGEGKCSSIDNNEEDQPKERVPMDVDTSDTSEKNEVVLGLFYQELVTAAGVHNRKLPSGEQLVKCVEEGVLPFLRCCALYYHYVMDIVAPDDLQEGGVVPGSKEEFYALSRYLSLPVNMSDLLQSSLLRQLALSWARHARIHFLVNDDLLQASKNSDPNHPLGTVLVRHPMSVNQLVPLPEDYSELINNVSIFSCPNSDGDDCRSPTMCLVCGEILCSQSYCCQTELDNKGMVGACTHHAHYCGAGTGIFLRVRDCKVLFLASRSKGCYMAPPYVDNYGETDQGLMRGNPLHLCHERYRDLHRLWLSHNIPEQIAHALELSTSLSATNWQLM